jgi:hypothetical protein
MNRTLGGPQRGFPYGEGVITALSVGGFLIILGITFALTPGTWQQVQSFFSDLTTVHYHIGGTGSTVSLLGPANPGIHAGFYSAVLAFCLAIGVLQAIILALRLIMRSRVRRISETIGNLVFWFGAAVLVNVFLMAGTLTSWFQFWAALVALVGVSLIARGIVYLFRRQTWKT